MSINKFGKKYVPFIGDHLPAAIYNGPTKVSGWNEETISGTELSILDTFNDTADVTVEGDTIQTSDYYAKDGQTDVVSDYYSVDGDMIQSSDYYAKDGLSSQVSTVQGKNLFDKSKMTTLALSTTITSVGNGRGYFFPCKPDTIYSAKRVTPTTNRFVICFTDILPAVGVNFYNSFPATISTNQLNNDVTISSTSGTNSKYVFLYFSNASESIPDTMLCEGSMSVYEPFVPNSPSPEYPSPITSNLPAGTYKYTSTDGIYEFTLAEELRGIGTNVDKVVFDRVSHRGILERRCGNVLKNNNSGFWKSAGGWETRTATTTFEGYDPIEKSTGVVAGNSIDIISDKIPGLMFNTLYGSATGIYGVSWHSSGKFVLAVPKEYLTTQDVTGLGIWLASINPVFIYKLKTPSYTPLTFTKVSSSNATEVPMVFLTNTPSLLYPADVFSTLPASSYKYTSTDGIYEMILAKDMDSIGTTKDKLAFDRLSHRVVVNKKISDWVILDGSRTYLGGASSYKTLKEVWLSISQAGLSSPFGVLSTEKVYKNDSVLLTHTNQSTVADTSAFDGNTLYMRILNTDSGWSEAYSVLLAEIKAYFYGWKMANADGTSPYYKSEVPYTPSTWAEWSKSGTTVDSTGCLITADGSTYKNINMPTSFKVSVSYGILVNVLSTTCVNKLVIDPNGFVNASGVKNINNVIGIQKIMFTTKATIETNTFKITNIDTEPAGNAIKLKDIRIFELPTGSQIEADFNTLTADQLAAKYTFNGLCTKNWLHVTDGLGLTSVLPTATYAGYTPYKMKYELASPVVTNITPTKVASSFLPALSMASLRKNLFDKSVATSGFSVNSTTGITNVNATLAVSDYISVMPLTTYRKISTGGWVVYDSQKVYISGNSGGVNTLTTPTNSMFIRFNIPIASVNTEQFELGSTATTYEDFKPISDPTFPATITTNLPAGTYKYTSTDGIYEFTLPSDLHGIGTVVDKIVFDRKSHRGILERRNGKKALDGTETSWYKYSLPQSGWVLGTGMTAVWCLALPDKGIGYNTSKCTHFNNVGNSTPFDATMPAIIGVYTDHPTIFTNYFRWGSYDTATLVDFKAWLALTLPVLIYQLKTPTSTPLTFTKVLSSTAPECPMAFLTSTPSLPYPADVVSVVGSLKSHSALPSIWATNLVTNGDFSNGTIGWDSIGGIRTVGNNEVTSLATSQFGRLAQVIPNYSLYKGHLLYFRAKMKADNWSVILYVNDGTYQLGVYTTDISEYHQFSKVIEISPVATALSIKVQDNRASGWSTSYFKEIFMIDLTETFGAGNEPTALEMDAMIPVWFNGKAKISDDVVTYNANSPSVLYPASKMDTATLPPLNKIGLVKDSVRIWFGQLTGWKKTKTQRISDWVILDGGKGWNDAGNIHNINSKRPICYGATIGNASSGDTQYICKYDSKKLVYSAGQTQTDSFINIGSSNAYIMVPNTDSGWGDMITPIANEIKAYFYGWKMCNADGSSPYYKSEVPYTPSTWAEWQLTTASADATGVIMVQSTTLRARVFFSNRTFKPSTKYGVIYSVISNSGFITYYGRLADINISIPTIIGNNKSIGVTNSTISLNTFFISDNSYASAEGIFKFKDIRIYELPTGSQIESDFTNLTADALALKYTFNGLCVKNWKHVTDDLGLTSTLPTATYAGYTPYKMMYELAVPVITELTPEPLRTYYDTTFVETDTNMSYKNEVAYTPSTWAEWVKYVTTTVDVTGMEMVTNAANYSDSEIPTLLKLSTKYLILFNVVSTSLVNDNSIMFGGGSTCFATTSILGTKTAGNKKTIATTLSSITTNKLRLLIAYTQEAVGTKIKLKDIRIYELPAGSQIESDANTLTADQLAVRYPFNGKELTLVDNNATPQITATVKRIDK